MPLELFADTNVVNGDPSHPGLYLKGMLLVLFYETASQAERQAALDHVGGTVIGGTRSFGADGFYFVRVPGGDSLHVLFAAGASLEALPAVEYAAPPILDGIVDSHRLPTDASGLWEQWALRPEGASGPNRALELIEAPMAWGCSTGGATVPIAVVDAGFGTRGVVGRRGLHADLQGNTNLGLSRLYGDTIHQDITEHGVPVASILAAVGDNNQGLTGVMWAADLRLYERYADTLNTAERADWAMIHHQGVSAMAQVQFAHVYRAGADGAAVINLSFNPDPKAEALRAYSRALRSVIRRLHAASPARAPLFVISAGNGSRDALWSGAVEAKQAYPDQVLIVSSTGADRARVLLANNGPHVDLYAPGDATYSLARDSAGIYQFGGTSAAAPLVTGVAGLLKGFDPTLTAGQLKEVILEGSENSDTLRIDGKPFLNAYGALKRAAEQPGRPLCGNRVWSEDDGRIMAQRGAGVEELANVGYPGDYFYIAHGGQRIAYSTFSGEGLYIFNYQSNGTWALAPGDPWESEEMCYVYCMYTTYQQSHDRDLVAGSTYLYANQTTYDITLADTTDTWARWQIGTVPRYPVSSATQEFATRRSLNLVLEPREGGGTDTTIGEPRYHETKRTEKVAQDRSYVWPGISPVGDLVYVAVTRGASTLHIDADWTPCEGTAYFRSDPIQECRDWGYNDSYSGTEFYTVPMSMTQAAVAGTPQPNLARSGRVLDWFMISEDGRELVIGDGFFSSTGPNGRSDCRMTWVDSRTGDQRHTVPSAHACYTERVGGFAPRRVAAGSRSVVRPAVHSGGTRP